jgi:Yip1 domain
LVNRTYTYIIISIGFLLAIAGFLMLGFSGAVPGIAVCFLGLVLFGLSFVPRPAPPADAPQQMSEGERLTGIFFEPSRVFRNLRAHPHWLVPIIIMTVLAYAYTTAFTFRLTPERIVSFTNDKLVERGFIPADRAAQIKEQQIAQAKSTPRIALNIFTTFVGAFAAMAFIAALYMLGALLFGGRLGYWQALAVTVYAALPISVIGRVLSLVLLYVKDPDDIHPILGQGGLVQDNLGVLVKAAEHPVIYTVLTSFGILSFYHLWLTATGLRNGGERVTTSAAWSVALIIWGLGLLLGAGFSALFGNFIS